mmetsp:Transcript_9194/g.11104  ORF Transcript_9194/g.11104 Transcript_9194/m.11104 type:complete len:300 (+) Transcript_9194:2053-2952(+)
MSDREALRIFSRQPVSEEMVSFLASTTSSVIQVKTPKPQKMSMNDSNLLISPVVKTHVPLTVFIKKLIKYSNVQTPTLMASLIYLNKLRNILPANAVGMETTRHRIFLGSLILSAKSLNDSSPMNKHWTKYTDGLLSIEEVNMAERELIGLLKWDINVKEDELIMVLQPFLTSIKNSIRKKHQDECNAKINYYRLSNTYKCTGSRSNSSTSISSIKSSMSLNSSQSSLSLHSNSSSSYNLASFDEQDEFATLSKQDRIPLSGKSINTLNIPTENDKAKFMYSNYNQSGINVINNGRILV